MNRWGGLFVLWVALALACTSARSAYSTPIVNQPGYSVELFATGLGAANGMAVGPTGDLFVADYDGGRVLKIPAPFQPGLNSFQVYASGMAFVNDVAFTTSGRMFVTPSTGASSDVLEVFSDGHTSVYATGFSFPSGIAAKGDELYVSGSGDGTIKRIDSGGNVHPFLSGYGNGNGPYGVSFDSAGNLYFTVHGTGAIYASDVSANVQLLGSGSALGVSSTVVTSIGDLLVSDALAAVILEQTSGGFVAFASGFEGKSNPPFIGPNDIAFDSVGNMYVSDASNIWRISVVPEPPNVILAAVGAIAIGLTALQRLRKGVYRTTEARTN